MKIIVSKYLLALIVLAILQLNAQNLNAQTDSSKKVIYEFADVMPEFKGNLLEYLAKNVKYPKEAINNNVQGIVYANIVIDTGGKVSEVIIKKDIGLGCGKEVQRVLYEMPDWKPATQNGKPVNFKMTVPVKFVLDSKNYKGVDKIAPVKKKNRKEK